MNLYSGSRYHSKSTKIVLVSVVLGATKSQTSQSGVFFTACIEYWYSVFVKLSCAKFATSLHNIRLRYFTLVTYSIRYEVTDSAERVYCQSFKVTDLVVLGATKSQTSQSGEYILPIFGIL
ncbi:hypothetical protein LX92_02976 [Maribacter polysiphoniae]|uniref:Uncharacterized protein n=1 Tax=Maribacter polysiphoniae TaxID=429344 RepID=A0A316DYU8_9FLAO|nr:hypothetical protein LX92_02976 [Maribacter polysiphoniae]